MAEDILVEVLERLRVLTLHPDDTLVLLSPEPLSLAAVDRMRELCEREFPGRRIMVLDSGTQVGILRQAEGEDAPR